METIASHITEKKVFGNGRVFVAPTGAKDVVTIEGSVLGGYNLLPRDKQAVPAIATRLFDAGTKLHAKDVLRDTLAARGSHISFTAGADRTYFSGSCLPEDLPFILKTVSECIGTAIFAPSEIARVRTELLDRLKESKTNTMVQASQELFRLIYDPAHVNYIEKSSVVQKNIENVTKKDLQSFQKLLGNNNLIISIAGDVVPASAITAVQKAFKTLPVGTTEIAPKNKNKKAAAREDKKIFIPHKSSIDVLMGTVLPITYADPLYLPLRIAIDLLGSGGFNCHLMKTVRERDGLTYATRAMLGGFQKDTEGALQVYASFAPDLYDRGFETLKREVEIFFSKELTQENLMKKKGEMAGEYAISLSTTGGMANRLHLIGERGYDLSYMDTYLDQIRAVSLEELKDAAKLVDVSKLSMAAVGTFAK